jgi:hypothetical protein
VVVRGEGECAGTDLPHTLEEAGWAYGVRPGSHLTVAGAGDRCRCEPVGACRKPGTWGEFRDARVTAAA